MMRIYVVSNVDTNELLITLNVKSLIELPKYIYVRPRSTKYYVFLASLYKIKTYYEYAEHTRSEKNVHTTYKTMVKYKNN
jgi:hypothetical protein